MIEDSEAVLKKLSKVRGIWDMIKFQGDYTINLGLDCNYGPGLDRTEMILQRAHGENPVDRENSQNRQGSGFDILNYRELQHQSVISKVISAKQKIPFMKNFDDDLQNFLANYGIINKL